MINLKACMKTTFITFIFNYYPIYQSFFIYYYYWCTCYYFQFISNPINHCFSHLIIIWINLVYVFLYFPLYSLSIHHLLLPIHSFYSFITKPANSCTHFNLLYQLKPFDLILSLFLLFIDYLLFYILLLKAPYIKFLFKK